MRAGLAPAQGAHLPPAAVQVCPAKLSAVVSLSPRAFYGKCLSALPFFHGSAAEVTPGEMLLEVGLALRKSCV